MKKTCQGSCHCGAVRFEADIDLMQGTVRCNCSFCLKIRCWSAKVEPAAFRLLAGQDALSDYQFGAHREHHLFCRVCGARPFGKGDSRRSGPYVGVSVSCLDGLSDAELAAVPVTLVNGRDEVWDVPPAETGFL